MTDGMGLDRCLRGVLAALAVLGIGSAVAGDPPAARTMADVLAASTPGDWRALDPESTLYLQLAGGRVVIELAPAFAPEHAVNIRKLVPASGQAWLTHCYGMDLLSSLPRDAGPMGFYESPAQHVPIVTRAQP